MSSTTLENLRQPGSPQPPLAADQQPLQRSVAKPVTLRGRGLFLGQPARVTFHPAPANHGVVFQCADHGETRIPALVRYVVKRPRRTALKLGEACVETCEHVMSAVAGLAIDNVLVEVEGPELPMLDGSSKLYAEALLEAGLTTCDQPRRTLVISQPLSVQYQGASISVLPSQQPGMQIVYDLHYENHPIGHQLLFFNLHEPEQYLKFIAPARTYVMESEALALQKQGFGRHLTADDILVIGSNGPIGRNRLRFSDELVRHKIVDLIGDFYLLGAPIQGRVIAARSGHALNHSMVRRLILQHHQQLSRDLALHHCALDIRTLSRMMPHRYPMLLVDRVLEVDGDRRAVGVKNVTINEPFFTGHFPGTPVMPGVLIVEAMAQLSSVLVAQNIEHTGRLGMLLSLDRVKLRRPVVPGDQLILEAESVRIRSRIAHMRCRAYVGEELAAEAEVKFMLVDPDPR